MSVQSESDLISVESWTFRVRPSSVQPARLLVLVHGLKGDENSMWVFAGGLPQRYWIVAPRAPHAVESGGYTWRQRQTDEISRPDVSALRPAVDQLLQAIDRYTASVAVDASEFDVMGFSQGASVTTSLALLYPGRVGKAAMLSGFLPGGVDGLLADGRLNDKQLFVAHGTRDETIPVDEARRARERFEQAGASVSYCEDDVGHKLSSGCLRELKAFFQG